MMDGIQELQRDGCVLLTTIFSQGECRDLIERIDVAMRQDEHHDSVRESRGTVFAARNLIEIFPEVCQCWRKPALSQFLDCVLGQRFGLVRVLYFDKPSDRSWSLPFHKDMTIAVADNQKPSIHFAKPTFKSGVPHVEASESLLQNMLTLRIHLDQVTDENGPLQVIAGSHLAGKRVSAEGPPPQKILCDAGDVLAMRPLISHGSAHSKAGTQYQHRRILHLEFAAHEELPDGFKWQHFIR